MLLNFDGCIYRDVKEQRKRELLYRYDDIYTHFTYSNYRIGIFSFCPICVPIYFKFFLLIGI